MLSQDDDQQGLVLAIVGGLVALVIAGVVGLGIHQGKLSRSATKPAQPVVAAPRAPAVVLHVDTASAAQAATDAASVKVENGVVKFYFASGKADLAVGAADALAEVVKGAKAGRKLLVSGFHDASGDAAKNAELALERAKAVREALKTAGVSATQIELKKPEQTAGTGSDAEARRVEVSLQ